MKQILFLAFIMMGIFACKDQENTYIYAETKCSDAWTKNADWSASNSAPETLIKKYLTDSLKVNFSDFARTNDGTEQACEACICLSGTRVKVTCSEDDKNKLLNFGFKKQ